MISTAFLAISKNICYSCLRTNHSVEVLYGNYSCSSRLHAAGSHLLAFWWIKDVLSRLAHTATLSLSFLPVHIPRLPMPFLSPLETPFQTVLLTEFPYILLAFDQGTIPLTFPFSEGNTRVYSPGRKSGAFNCDTIFSQTIQKTLNPLPL
jgi:hypothetical protein